MKNKSLVAKVQKVVNDIRITWKRQEAQEETLELLKAQLTYLQLNVKASEARIFSDKLMIAYNKKRIEILEPKPQKEV